jgi:hypothetical protein
MHYKKIALLIFCFTSSLMGMRSQQNQDARKRIIASQKTPPKDWGCEEDFGERAAHWCCDEHVCSDRCPSLTYNNCCLCVLGTAGSMYFMPTLYKAITSCAMVLGFYVIGDAHNIAESRTRYRERMEREEQNSKIRDAELREVIAAERNRP